jgi:UDP-N-acetylmuramate--alanine ligase
MHIYFSGIGGTAIGPLALIAKQAGFKVSGSDKQDSQYIKYLKKHDVTDIHIGQDLEQIAAVHDKNPIDWFVYSSAITMENPNPPELLFCREQNIKTSKRDELINLILTEKKLKLIAVAGTHGKTTTTAMVVWLFKELGLPISYSVGAKISFGDMGQYKEGSEYFVYECDEFDRNFLAFEPFVSIITGVSWDHHEIYPTREDYQQAFKEFIDQSEWTEIWREDHEYLGLQPNDHHAVMDSGDTAIDNLRLPGHYNRLDAWLAIKAVRQLTQKPLEKIIEIMNGFPGLQRRMEEIIPCLYSDYAHTPEKIRGAMSVALEMAQTSNKDLAVVYEPLTNRRQHYMMNDYGDVFSGAKKVYWIPSYLAREDAKQRIIPPAELITRLSDPSIAEAKERDTELKQIIQSHLDKGDMVVAMAGGGGDSLDEWVRKEFTHDS